MDKLCCKWVSQDMTTKNDTKWQEGVPNELPEGHDLMLCYPGLYHYYEHPLLAVMFKDHHVPTNYTKLYEIKVEGTVVEGWDKSGATKLTLIKELEIPEVTLINKVAFGILCALEVCEDPTFIDWANNWLSGKERSKEYTSSSADEINWCAYAAVHAAYSVVYGYACIEDAVYQIAYHAANDHFKKVNLSSLAKKAMEIK